MLLSKDLREVLPSIATIAPSDLWAISSDHVIKDLENCIGSILSKTL